MGQILCFFSSWDESAWYPRVIYKILIDWLNNNSKILMKDNTVLGWGQLLAPCFLVYSFSRQWPTTIFHLEADSQLSWSLVFLASELAFPGALQLLNPPLSWYFYPFLQLGQTEHLLRPSDISRESGATVWSPGYNFPRKYQYQGQHSERP